jgi:dTDP-4-amino-4,6-dideoxygalactose transaminase
LTNQNHPISFSPPFIDEEIINEVVDALRSGWITTGPKTKTFEKELAAYCGVEKVLCLNSATAGLEMMLRWYGVQEGDEVIVPAYTYAATANVVVHCGARPVMVDVDDNFQLDIDKLAGAITSHTKAIIPVDIFGLPTDYDAIMDVLNSEAVKKKFTAANSTQDKLGRPMLLIDSAHSIGAVYKGKKVGSQADAMVFSFHAVKNLTTAEGGCIALKLNDKFDLAQVYQELNIKSLHGQTKDALSKSQSGAGAWRYDIVEAGYKFNMPDVLAAIGLAGFRKYDPYILPRRKEIFDLYTEGFSKYSWAITPLADDEFRSSSYHVYPLRIKGINEKHRDQVIYQMAEHGIATNVHYQPLPLLSFYKNNGYRMEDYPKSFALYEMEVSLPVYPQLTEADIERIVNDMAKTVEAVYAETAA